MWLLMAVLSAFFAGLTSVLAKGGIRRTDSDVATLLRTGVVLAFSWLMVGVTGAGAGLGSISAGSLLFLTLSGLATGGSWLMYFKALSMGSVGKVIAVDKLSTVLTVLAAIVLFGETAGLPLKLASAALLLLGTWLMLDRKAAAGEKAQGQSGGASAQLPKDGEAAGTRWLPYALASAALASATSILAKAGIRDVDSTLATALRTGVVLLMALLVVRVKGKQGEVKRTGRRELLFIALSGVATGASWLCYYYALRSGPVSVVVPVDKMSILFAVTFSWFMFGERQGRRALLGLGIMTLGTLGMALAG